MLHFGMGANRHLVAHLGKDKIERSKLMRPANRYLLTLALIAIVTALQGCASGSPSTTQAPPEIAEKKPPATVETGGQGEGGGGEGSGQSGGEDGGSGEEGEASADGAGQGGGAQPGGAPPAGSPTTGGEAAAALDQELDGALEEFDQKMREEIRRLAEEAAEAERAAGGASDSGGATGATSGGTGETDGSTEEVGDSGGSVGGSGPGGSGSDRIPSDVGDGSDDDIVARQLREAAMAEDDPELREKLWEEYRRYKASLGGSDKDN